MVNIFFSRFSRNLINLHSYWPTDVRPDLTDINLITEGCHLIVFVMVCFDLAWLWSWFDLTWLGSGLDLTWLDLTWFTDWWWRFDLIWKITWVALALGFFVKGLTVACICPVAMFHGDVCLLVKIFSWYNVYRLYLYFSFFFLSLFSAFFLFVFLFVHR